MNEKQMRKKELGDIFGDKIDSNGKGWAGPRVDCDVSDVSNGPTGKLRGALFWPFVVPANLPPSPCPPDVFPATTFPSSSSVSIFTSRLEGGGVWGGLDGIIIDT